MSAKAQREAGSNPSARSQGPRRPANRPQTAGYMTYTDKNNFVLWRLRKNDRLNLYMVCANNLDLLPAQAALLSLDTGTE